MINESMYSKIDVGIVMIKYLQGVGTSESIIKLSVQRIIVLP